MIIQQQQDLIVGLLTPLLDPSDTRLSKTEKVALKAALKMTLADPVIAGEYAAALEMLLDSQKRKEDKA